jgi:hypothetical protein
MGKAMPSTGPDIRNFLSESDLDVERLQGKALKLYLEHKLRELEQQISVLSASGGWQRPVGPGMTPRPMSRQEDEWELSMDLGYLRASRDAIISALSIL